MGRDARIWFLGEGEDRALWERALAEGAWREGECLKQDDRGRAVFRAEVLGQLSAVKTRPMPKATDRLRLRFGATDLARSCLGAALLEAKGFATPKVRVMGLARLDSGWHEVLVTQWAPGQSLLALWVDADASTRRGLARRAGVVVGRLAVAGVFNRDCKPSNLIIDGDEIGFVDVGGVRATGGDRAREVARMVSMLGFEPAGIGQAPTFWDVVVGVRSALGVSGIDRLARWRAILVLRRLIAEHGDPTPKDHPVAPEAKMR